MAIFCLSSLNGANGFKLDGETNNDQSGCSVSAAGDINGDGHADLLIGAMVISVVLKVAVMWCLVVLGWVVVEIFHYRI